MPVFFDSLRGFPLGIGSALSLRNVVIDGKWQKTPSDERGGQEIALCWAFCGWSESVSWHPAQPPSPFTLRIFVCHVSRGGLGFRFALLPRLRNFRGSARL